MTFNFSNGKLEEKKMKLDMAKYLDVVILCWKEMKEDQTSPDETKVVGICLVCFLFLFFYLRTGGMFDLIPINSNMLANISFKGLKKKYYEFSKTFGIS